LAARPVDFRKGSHGLAALAAEVLGEAPFSGTVLVWKRLSHGAFRWPPVVDGVMTLSALEFAALFDGLDWTRVQATKRIPMPSVAA
jgi:transposase